MRDETTNVIKISFGEFIIKVLKSDKEFLANTMTIPSFESGSQLKILISDTEIALNYEGIVKYKTVDEFFDLIEKDGSKSKAAKKVKKAAANSKANDVKEASPAFTIK